MVVSIRFRTRSYEHASFVYHDDDTSDGCTLSLSPSFLVRSAWNWMNSNFFSQLDTAGTVTMLVMKKLIVTVTIVVVVKLVML